MIGELTLPAAAAIGAATRGGNAPARESVALRGEGLAEAWRAMAAAADLPTQLPSFYTALSGSLLAGSAVTLFKVTEGQDLRAILPLCRGRKRFARWRMVGAREVFEPIDALCRDAAAARDLAETIAALPAPVVFDRVPQDSPFLSAYQTAMQGRGLVRVRPATGCPYIALDKGWREPEAQYNSGRRSDFRRAMRRAEALGAVTFEVLSPRVDQFDALFTEAVAVELASWKQAAGTAIGADRGKEGFFRHFLHCAARDGSLRVAFMRIDGRAVAMQLALEWHGRFWLFKIGFDEEFSRCSPGTLLMLHTLGWAAGRGLDGYEMLGNVEPWIAAFWTREAHPCVRLRSYPFNLAGALALVSDGLAGVAGQLRHVAHKVTRR